MKYILLSLLVISNLFASQNDQIFKELLEKVKSGYKEQTLEDKQREQRFLNDVKNQQKMLTKMKADVKKAKDISLRLKNKIKSNEMKLQKLSTELDIASGDLGELFGTVKQVSSDMNVHIKNSLISSQFPKRKEFLKELSSKKELPNINELEKLWYITFQEIIESGKIVKYTTDVISKEGEKTTEEIIRIGNFNALNQDSFLKYNTSNSLFIELLVQSSYGDMSKISDYFNSDEKISETIVDPTRGVILDVMSQKPNLQERLSQAGAIGFIIILLGIIGIVFALYKYIRLVFVAKQVNEQLKNSSNIDTSNPLGRILQAYETNKNMSHGDLEYKVDEAFHKEIPSIQSGFSMIKLFAATTPLLGLLGTVTGMILTFQSITLFGTSDPKLMAGGISQALITTMLGLIAAIPLLFAHTLLNSKSKKIMNILEQNSIALIAKKMDSNV